MWYAIGGFFLFVVLPLLGARACGLNTRQEIQEYGGRPEDLVDGVHVFPDIDHFLSVHGDPKRIPGDD